MAISSGGISELFPYVIRLSNELKLLTRWIVVPFRQRLQNAANLELRIGDIVICGKDIFFVSKDVGNRLDLVIFIKGVDNVDNSVINAVFLVLDSVLGEYDVTSEIGKIEVKPFSSLNNGEKAQGLSMLPEIIDQMK